MKISASRILSPFFFLVFFFVGSLTTVAGTISRGHGERVASCEAALNSLVLSETIAPMTRIAELRKTLNPNGIAFDTARQFRILAALVAEIKRALWGKMKVTPDQTIGFCGVCSAFAKYWIDDFNTTFEIHPPIEILLHHTSTLLCSSKAIARDKVDWHAFVVIRFGGDTNQEAYLVDPSFAQFFTHSKEARYLRHNVLSDKDEPWERELLSRGFVALTPPRAVQYLHKFRQLAEPDFYVPRALTPQGAYQLLIDQSSSQNALEEDRSWYLRTQARPLSAEF